MKKIVINNNIKIMSIITLIAILTLFIIMCIDLLPLMKNIVENLKDENVVVKEVGALGSKGIIVMLSLSVLQVFSIFIPSTPIQILTGLSFGLVEGYIIAISGFMIGNVLVFLLARNFKEVFHFSVKEEQEITVKKHGKWDFLFLKNAKNLSAISFLLFFLPGVPSGLLPYVFANSKIKLRNYIISLLLGSSPTIILSIMIGDRVSKSHIGIAFVLAIIIIIATLIAVLKRKKIIELLVKL